MAIAVDTLDGAHVLLVGSAEWTTPLADALETRVGATVETVTTADAALSVLDDCPVECVVSEYALDGRAGLELLRTIREGSPTLPVVLCTASGSEAVAVNDVNGAIFDPDGLDISTPTVSTSTRSPPTRSNPRRSPPASTTSSRTPGSSNSTWAC